MKKILTNYRYWVLFLVFIIAVLGIFSEPVDTLPRLRYYLTLLISKIVGFGAAWLDWRLIKFWEAKGKLPELSDDQILLEPDRRNTAPCIAWAAYHIRAINPNAVMLVSPSDHLILREDVFKDCVTRGLDFVARYPYLLTMGIQPNRPETGYGYIQMGKEEIDGFSRVKTFTEKPDFELAKVSHTFCLIIALFYYFAIYSLF